MTDELNRLQKMLNLKNEGQQIEDEIQTEQDLDPKAEDISDPNAPKEMDPAFKAALEKRDRMQKASRLLSGFQSLIKGATGFQDDGAVAKSLAQEGQQAVGDYKAQKGMEAAKVKADREAKQADQMEKLRMIEIRGKEYDAADQEKTRDPNSPISQASQQFIIDHYAKQGTPLSPEKISRIKSMSTDDLHDEESSLRDFVKFQTQSRLKQNIQMEAEERKNKFSAGESEKSRQFTASENEKKRTAKLEDEKKKIDYKIDAEDRQNTVKEAAANKKERTQIAKENRKEVKKIDDILPKLKELRSNIITAQKLQKEYSDKHPIHPGTGAIATLGGLTSKFSADLQALEDIYETISLSNMGKMFEGMSKAVDSDAERAKFEASQANIRKDDPVNMSNLNRQLKYLDDIIKRHKDAKNDFINNNTAEKLFKNQKRELQQSEGLSDGGIQAPPLKPPSEGTILMESPDGQRVRVKSEAVDKYLSKGAKIVQ